MVQEYKTSDLDLFDKIDLQNPKDLFIKNKSINQHSHKTPKSFKYSNQEINKFKNLENNLNQNKSKKISHDFFNQVDIDDYSSFKSMYPHNLNLNKKYIFPNYSLVKNIGFDGSGINSKVNNSLRIIGNRNK